MPDPYQLATLNFGIAHERAAVDWFDQLTVVIQGKGPRTPVLDEPIGDEEPD